MLVFIFVLFLDSINRVSRVQEKTDMAEKNSDIRIESSISTQKFYNQRNFYLTGFTLFLSLVLNFTYTVILDLLETEEKLDILHKKSSENGDSTQLEKQKKEVARLRDELALAKKKVLDFETLKKQADQQHAEFNRLADEHAALIKQEDASDVKKES
ncbi:Endoplasmic reticulum transmembrane protein 3 [Entomophthora muscae]|uniref:Endoplasmic reticulum transmembrane protein 3 n=1 Tax=Entomophthora muscae TaxID=34485 RepID=A0ACC2TUM1_9FUNG|nr:Endoplasmic reticulum transmembrane protein 3 [Entomophthora muscae]